VSIAPFREFFQSVVQTPSRRLIIRGENIDSNQMERYSPWTPSPKGGASDDVHGQWEQFQRQQDYYSTQGYGSMARDPVTWYSRPIQVQHAPDIAVQFPAWTPTPYGHQVTWRNK
jgi:hypothetical protein